MSDILSWNEQTTNEPNKKIPAVCQMKMQISLCILTVRSESSLNEEAMHLWLTQNVHSEHSDQTVCVHMDKIDHIS